MKITPTSLTTLPQRIRETGRVTMWASRPRRRSVNRFISDLPLVIAIVSIIVLATTTNLGAWVSLAMALFASAVLIRAKVSPRIIAIKVMALVVGVSALDYLIWRIQVVNLAAWWVAVPLVVAEVFGILHTLGFQYTVWPRRKPDLRHDEDPTLRPIFILIPTVNEGVSVLSPTIQGALAARERYLTTYPHGQVTIVVCNDGLVAGAPDWKQTERLARELNVECITRTVKGGAKAGNIENARLSIGATGNALIAIFDADQVAEPEFLLETIQPFADSRIGWVQTGQYYRNLDNPVSVWANDQQALFYQVLCPGKSNQNAAFICGTNVVLRASALDEIGGLSQDSVTEDFATSIELHSRWRSIFLPGVLATGLGPMTMKSYLKQQDRWAVGTLGEIKRHWQQIFLPWVGNLTLPQRIQYALACTHYLSGVRDLIYILTPIVFIVTSASAVRGADITTFMWHFLPYWISSQIAFWYVAWNKTSFRGILMGLASFYTLIGSVVTVFLGHSVSFAITSKTREADGPWKVLRPHTIALGLCLLAILLGLYRQLVQNDTGRTLVSLFWVLYTIALLGGVLWLGYCETVGDTASALARLNIPRQLPLSPRRQQRALITVLATAPVFMLVLVFVSPMLGRVFAADTPKFSVRSAEMPRLFGLTLPSDLLLSDPARVKSELSVPPSIIGRVQDISDRFDTNWANTLAAQGQQPWLVLLFHHNGDPIYMSSLPAITNGVYDDQIREWASSIHAFNKPIYITILPHVDRNWALSSAVTNGGIPQDVSRAWLHVRKIFDAEHAQNVAWVWAPADPANDQGFAPPAYSIDVVLLSMISYPHTTWADPVQALQDVVARYPGMPLFVEVSAAGEPVEKAAWLTRVGKAVSDGTNIRALFYHDGSPDTTATLDTHKIWLLDSDPLSLAAVQTMVKTAGLKTLSVENKK